MKPHNTHVLQPLSLYRLKCLFRFLYVVLRFGGRSADFRTVTNAAQSDLVFFFPHREEKEIGASEVQLPWGTSSLFPWKKHLDLHQNILTLDMTVGVENFIFCRKLNIFFFL